MMSNDTAKRKLLSALAHGSIFFSATFVCIAVPLVILFISDDEIIQNNAKVKNEKLEPQSIQGVPQVLAAGQGGLLDVAVHPNFSENGYIYLTYASGTRNSNQTKIARGILEENQLRDVEVIFEVAPAKNGEQHFGSRLQWLKDGTLLASIGDGGTPPLKIDGELIRKQALKLDSYLGKIIRINDDGSIPENNPFLDQENANPAIWSYGHRNIQGLTIDKKTGQIL